MSAAEKFLTEAQTADYAGVSPETLRQYVDLGLLHPAEQHGKRVYPEAELKNIFQITKVAEAGSATISFEVPPEIRGAQDAADALAAATSGAAAAGGVDDREGPHGDADGLRPADDNLGSTGLTTRGDLDGDKQAAAYEGAQHADDSAELIAKEDAASGREIAVRHDDSLSTLDARYVGQYELVEINRSLRDQVQMLKDERDWLRTRLERLEDRTQRDQMILMSETETIREMVTAQTRKKSIWGFLPWMR